MNNFPIGRKSPSAVININQILGRGQGEGKELNFLSLYNENADAVVAVAWKCI
jgi:hypothetical protein